MSNLNIFFYFPTLSQQMQEEPPSRPQVWDILEPTMLTSCMKASWLARCLRTRSSLGDMFIGVVHSRPLKSVLSPRNYSNYPTWDYQLNLDGQRAKQYEDRGMYEQNYCPRKEGALQMLRSTLLKNSSFRLFSVKFQCGALNTLLLPGLYRFWWAKVKQSCTN